MPHSSISAESAETLGYQLNNPKINIPVSAYCLPVAEGGRAFYGIFLLSGAKRQKLTSSRNLCLFGSLMTKFRLCRPHP